MRLSRTGAPASQPITLAEAKAHLRLTSTAHDTLIANLISAATELVDGRYGILRRALITQTWQLQLYDFPVCRHIELPLPPLQSVTSVQYYDTSNVLQTFANTEYSVGATEFVGRIDLNDTASWPGVYDREDAVTITFVAGYGIASTVPMPIKQALLLMVAALFANPEGGPAAIPPAAAALLGPHMVREVPR